MIFECICLWFYAVIFFFFFFSSRRRHTRSYGDWSSDVCSSDLIRVRLEGLSARIPRAHDRPAGFVRTRIGGSNRRSRTWCSRLQKRHAGGGAELRALPDVLLLLETPGKSLRRPALQQWSLRGVHSYSAPNR